MITLLANCHVDGTPAAPSRLGTATTDHQRAARAEGFCPDCLVPLGGVPMIWCPECKTFWPTFMRSR